MANKVSVLDKDGAVTYYSSYLAARNDIINSSIQHPLIQIWATLNEQIILLSGADIWLAPGVILDYNPINDPPNPGPTITDNNQAVVCNIYGNGIIKNLYSGTTKYECIKIVNPNTYLTIECDYIEGLGSTTIGFVGESIRIENCKKFHLSCNKVYNQNNIAMNIGSSSVINDLNLSIQKVDTGIPNTTNTGGTAMVTRANGFIKIDEILCRNLGHCLSHRAGEVTATIKKMSTKMNRVTNISALHLDQDSIGTQKLILYFDEILSLAGTYEAYLCIEHHQGTGIFIGRRIISESVNFPNFTAAIQISISNSMTPLPKGYLKINEIISKGGVAMYLNDFTSQYIIDSTYIECNGAAVISSNDTEVNYLIKNAKLNNLNNSTDSKGIALDSTLPNLTFNNVKIVAGGKLINLVNGTVDIKNYGLFGNKDIDNTHIILIIGNFGNFQFIPSPDLT